MVRACFGGDQIAGRSQEFGFLGGRHVQHMKSVIMSIRQVDGSLCGNDGRFVIPNATVVGIRLPAVQTLGIRLHGGFVFAMSADRQIGFREDAFKGLLFVDQQVARTRSNKNFDAGGTFRLLQNIDIVRSGSDVEAVVDDTLLCRDVQFCVQSIKCGGG